MFHARQSPTVAHRFIQRILRGGRAKCFAVAPTEPLDAVFVEQRLAGGQQQMLVNRCGGSLGAGIEQTQAFQLIAEEIEP